MSDRFTWTDPVLCSYSFDLSKEWFVYFDITDTETQITKRKQFRANINSFKTKEERVLHGNALISYWKQELKRGWHPFGENIRIPQKHYLLKTITYLNGLKIATLRKRTKETYEYREKVITEWITANRLQDIELHRFNVEMANNFTDWLILTKGYENRTYNDFKGFMSTLFKEMIRREWVTKNPFQYIKMKPTSIGRNTAFDDEERELLKKEMYQHDRELFYYTQAMYYCFIRRTELTVIKIRHIDFKNMTITIPVTDENEGAKNNSQESVVIPNGFVEIFKEMELNKFPGSWFIFGKGLKPGPEQFKYPNRISERHRAFTNKYNPGMDKEKGLYSWKHSGVCKAYDSTKDVFAIMRQCRHSEINTTQIYLKSLGLIDNTAIRTADW